MEIIRFRYNKAGIKKEIEEIQLRQEYLKICLNFYRLTVLMCLSNVGYV